VVVNKRNNKVEMLLRLRIPKKNVEVPDLDAISAVHEVSKSGDSAAKPLVSPKTDLKGSARKAEPVEVESSEPVKTKTVEVECE
jgi:hypothetical protein